METAIEYHLQLLGSLDARNLDRAFRRSLMFVHGARAHRPPPAAPDCRPCVRRCKKRYAASHGRFDVGRLAAAPVGGRVQPASGGRHVEHSSPIGAAKIGPGVRSGNHETQHRSHSHNARRKPVAAGESHRHGPGRALRAKAPTPLPSRVCSRALLPTWCASSANSASTFHLSRRRAVLYASSRRRGEELYWCAVSPGSFASMKGRPAKAATSDVTGSCKGARRSACIE